MCVVVFVDSEQSDLEAKVVVELPKAGGVWLRADEAVRLTALIIAVVRATSVLSASAISAASTLVPAPGSAY